MKQFLDSLTPLETGLIVGAAGILVVFIIGIFAFMRGTKEADEQIEKLIKDEVGHKLSHDLKSYKKVDSGE